MKYSVLLCGLLLMQAVGLSAKEQVRLSADDVTIGRTGDSVRVSFRLNVAGLGKDYVLKVTPLLRGKGGQETELPKLNYGSRRAQIVEWREGSLTRSGWRVPLSVWKRRARAVAAKRRCRPCGCLTRRCLPLLPSCLSP